jgi:hypothetical protein
VSLLLHVGWLDGMRRNDREGFRAAKKEFAARVESHNLLALHRACRRSIRPGAAIYLY